MARKDNRPERFRKMVETLDRQRSELASKPTPRQKLAADRRSVNLAHMDHLAAVLAGMALAIEEGDHRLATYKTKADVEFVTVATPPHLKPLVAEMVQKGNTWRIQQDANSHLAPDEVICRDLAEDGDRIAPVSGCRCRGCGANAKRRPVGEVWHIRDQAAWCHDCHKAPMEVVVTYTNAPERYDGFGTKTVVADAGEFSGQDVRKVETPVEHLEWQRSRYASGCYCAMSETEWQDNLKARLVTENQPVAVAAEPVATPVVEPVAEVEKTQEKPAEPVAEQVVDSAKNQGNPAEPVQVVEPVAKTKRLVLPTNLGGLAKCAESNSSPKFGGIVGVKLECQPNGYRVAATDGKVAILVDGVCQQADEYPVLDGESQWPNGETSAIIPATAWAEAMAKAGKIRLQDKHKKVLAVLGKTKTTLASLTNDLDSNVAQPRNVEGHFPALEKVIRDEKPAMKISVSAKRLAGLLNALASIMDGKDSEEYAVDIEVFAPNKPLQLRVSNKTLEQEIVALFMPLA